MPDHMQVSSSLTTLRTMKCWDSSRMYVTRLLRSSDVLCRFDLHGLPDELESLFTYLLSIVITEEVT